MRKTQIMFLELSFNTYGSQIILENVQILSKLNSGSKKKKINNLVRKIISTSYI